MVIITMLANILYFLFGLMSGVLLILLYKQQEEGNLKTRLDKNQLTAERNSVQQHERRRIGRELHDGILQGLYALGLQLEAAALQLTTNAQAASQLVEECIFRVKQVTGSTRAMIEGVRDPALPAGPLGRAIQELANEYWRLYRLQVSIQMDVPVHNYNGPEMEEGWWVIAEALFNAVRHGRASHVTIQGHQSGNILVISIKDNGQGQADQQQQPQLTGHGIKIMKERVRQMGGEINWHFDHGQGTVVTFFFPDSPSPMPETPG